jgi:hypothetical protein
MTADHQTWEPACCTAEFCSSWPRSSTEVLGPSISRPLSPRADHPAPSEGGEGSPPWRSARLTWQPSLRPIDQPIELQPWHLVPHWPAAVLAHSPSRPIRDSPKATNLFSLRCRGMPRSTTIFTRRARAKRRWLHEWHAWAAENISPDRQATEAEAFAFYTSRKNAPGLESGKSVTLWQSVRGWLFETGNLRR